MADPKVQEPRSAGFSVSAEGPEVAEPVLGRMQKPGRLSQTGSSITGFAVEPGRSLLKADEAGPHADLITSHFPGVAAEEPGIHLSGGTGRL